MTVIPTIADTAVLAAYFAVGEPRQESPVWFCSGPSVNFRVGFLVPAFYKSSGVTLRGGLAAREVFPYFIVTRMPAALRGLVIAGIQATAMAR